jgi:uncharacterized protein involved in type VI secretion and phage assembly
LAAATQQAQEARQDAQNVMLEYDRVQTRTEEARQAVAALDAEAPERAQLESELAELESQLSELNTKLTEPPIRQGTAEAAVVATRGPTCFGSSMSNCARRVTVRTDYRSSANSSRPIWMRNGRPWAWPFETACPSPNRIEIQQEINVLATRNWSP